MNIRRAIEKDIPKLESLLLQVGEVHHLGRPDLFRNGAKKYSAKELAGLLSSESRPIFVAVDESDAVVGYAFCIFQNHFDDPVMVDRKTLYIDDLCVDQNNRGHSVGTILYETILKYAKESGCYNVTLNVWSCNASAFHFYQKCGLQIQKIGMEQIL